MSGAGNYDPGWNDPPTFSYNPDAAAAKPKNLLNKRVPYAINSIPISKDLLPPTIGPPVGIFQPNILETKVDENELVKNSTVENTSNINFEESINIFKELVDNSPELGKKIVDIQKRLLILETMWREGKLNQDVQNKTARIAQALQQSNTKLADDVHKSLMVDYVSTVSPWMVGVKQLIFHYTAKNELLKIDQE